MHQKLFAKRHKMQEKEDDGGNQANQNGDARHIQKVMLDYYCCSSVLLFKMLRGEDFDCCL